MGEYESLLHSYMALGTSITHCQCRQKRATTKKTIATAIGTPTTAPVFVYGIRIINKGNSNAMYGVK